MILEISVLPLFLVKIQMGSNSGNITLSQYNYGLLANAGVGYFTTKGGSAVNNGTITAKVMEQESVIEFGASLGLNEANTFYSMRTV